MHKCLEICGTYEKEILMSFCLASAFSFLCNICVSLSRFITCNVFYLSFRIIAITRIDIFHRISYIYKLRLSEWLLLFHYNRICTFITITTGSKNYIASQLSSQTFAILHWCIKPNYFVHMHLLWNKMWANFLQVRNFKKC